MSYAGVESESEYAQRTYGLTDKKPKHCGSTTEHGTHTHTNGTYVCTGNLVREDGPNCLVCGRDNDNGTHRALERTGHLSHAFEPEGKHRA